MTKYDDNPDVDEVLRYSGAGAAIVARQRAEEDARIGAALDRAWASSRRWMAQEEESRRRAERSARFQIGVVVALALGLSLLLAFVVR